MVLKLKFWFAIGYGFSLLKQDSQTIDQYVDAVGLPGLLQPDLYIQ